MKKILLIALLSASSLLYANSISIGVEIGNNNKHKHDRKYRSDNHRYDSRYKNFNYSRFAYYDEYGYEYGYFNKRGYFYNNIFFLFDRHYRYQDRVKKRRHFKPNRAHFRPYKYHKVNKWNREHKYRKPNQRIYGHYSDRYDYRKKKINQRKHEKNYRKNKQVQRINEKNYRNNKQNKRIYEKDYRNNR